MKIVFKKLDTLLNIVVGTIRKIINYNVFLGVITILLITVLATFITTISVLILSSCLLFLLVLSLSIFGPFTFVLIYLLLFIYEYDKLCNKECKMSYKYHSKYS